MTNLKQTFLISLSIVLMLITSFIITCMTLAFAWALGENSMGYISAGTLLFFALALAFAAPFFVSRSFVRFWIMNSILTCSITIIFLGGTICTNLIMGKIPDLLILSLVLVVAASFAGGYAGKNVKDCKIP